jgi:hypothetical protein
VACRVKERRQQLAQVRDVAPSLVIAIVRAALRLLIAGRTAPAFARVIIAMTLASITISRDVGVVVRSMVVSVADPATPRV